MSIHGGSTLLLARHRIYAAGLKDDSAASSSTTIDTWIPDLERHMLGRESLWLLGFDIEANYDVISSRRSSFISGNSMSIHELNGITGVLLKHVDFDAKVVCEHEASTVKIRQNIGTPQHLFRS
jgi:hypothetical protein